MGPLESCPVVTISIFIEFHFTLSCTAESVQGRKIDMVMFFFASSWELLIVQKHDGDP